MGGGGWGKTLWILGLDDKNRGWGAVYTICQSTMIFENEEFCFKNT